MQPAKHSVCGPFTKRLNSTILNIENDDRTFGNKKTPVHLSLFYSNLLPFQVYVGLAFDTKAQCYSFFFSLSLILLYF